MMNRKEFQDYLQDNVKDYLPESFADANITFNETVKNNDVHLTGMSITRPDETIVPNIYIENYWQEYQKGKDIEQIVGDIADMRIEYDLPKMVDHVMDNIMNYSVAKEHLEIRLCDTRDNPDRLRNLVHTEHSDYSATYHVAVSSGPEGQATTPVTPELLEVWGVTVEQLHQDAMASDRNRGPVFCDMMGLMESMMFGRNPDNLLDNDLGDITLSEDGPTMYCLTNNDKRDGASLILQDDLMQQIGELVGGSFYVLPSSIHEVLILPESSGMNLRDLSTMVREVNATEVTPEDRLSDEVQFYDKDTHVLENAENRETRLEMEKAELTAARSRKSLHERLGENKVKVEKMKTEKSMEKGLKKAVEAEL